MILSIFASAKADVFDMKISTEAVQSTCSAQASEVSRLVGNVESVQSVTVSCINDEEYTEAGAYHRVYTFAVEYTSEDPIEVNTVVYSSRPYGLNYGIFATLQDCLSEKTNALNAFQLNNGTRANFVACRKDTASFDAQKYMLTLQSLKAAKLSFFSFDTANILPSNHSLQDDQLAFVKSELLRQGAKIAMESANGFFYYAAEGIPFQIDYVMRSANPAHCLSQVDRVRAIFAQVSGGAPYITCQAGPLTPSTGMQVVRSSGEYVSTDFGNGSEIYQSFERCMDMIDAAASRERGAYPNLFLGLICRPSDTINNAFVMEKFSRN